MFTFSSSLRHGGWRRSHICLEYIINELTSVNKLGINEDSSPRNFIKKATSLLLSSLSGLINLTFSSLLSRNPYRNAWLISYNYICFNKAKKRNTHLILDLLFLKVQKLLVQEIWLQELQMLGMLHCLQVVQNLYQASWL